MNGLLVMAREHSDEAILALTPNDRIALLRPQ